MRRKKLALVYLKVATPGSAGQTEFAESPTPIKVPCNLRPLSAVEIQFWGDHGRITQTLFCDTWPGTMDSRISIDGSDWDQVAPAEVFDYGATTQHAEVIIRKR